MKNAKEQLKDIYDNVITLFYSEDSFLDIINLLNRAIEIAKRENPDRRTNPCLNNLLQTQEKQLEAMKYNFKNEDERELYFNSLKENFLGDISGVFGFVKFPIF